MQITKIIYSEIKCVHIHTVKCTFIFKINIIWGETSKRSAHEGPKWPYLLIQNTLSRTCVGDSYK